VGTRPSSDRRDGAKLGNREPTKHEGDALSGDPARAALRFLRRDRIGGGGVARSRARVRRVLFQDENLSRAEARPSTISPAPTAGPYARRLTSWRGWGSQRASAEGTTYYDTCEPNCAEGVGSTSTEAILSGVHRCGGQLRYLRLRFVYFGASEYDLLMTFDCQGRTEHLHIGP
jgi:hypothetical protein